MDIRKPKPLHGWKEFLGEIGVIVIGISIALSAEAAIEALHWREQVRIAREAISTDMANKAGLAAEREALSACIDQHLNRFAEIIDEGARTGRFPPQGAMHRTPRRLWQLSSWQALSSAQIAAHVQPRQEVAISFLADYLQLVQNLEIDEDAQWARLFTLVGPGRPVDQGELPELRFALSRARGDAKSIRLAAAQIAANVAQMQQDTPEKIREARRTYLEAPGHARCLPDEPVPAHYGDGPPAGQSLTNPPGRGR